uniref:Uncharacterized protein n=1 Tax=Pristionchus pacificus TaxID=54126 RepID=A0A2A6BAH8_PRIPA|eukprot:PDM62873.1 hypothetical protein PRIPAC_50088 [Pristionchus pacificus]
MEELDGEETGHAACNHMANAGKRLKHSKNSVVSVRGDVEKRYRFKEESDEIRMINAGCYFEIRDLNEIGMRVERWEYDTEERNYEEELEWKKRRKRDREREGE